MYAVCQISRFFVRDPSQERFGTNDITLIVKPLLLICKCDVKDTAELMSKIGQDVVMTNDFEKLLPDVIAKGNVFAAERCAFGLYKRAVPEAAFFPEESYQSSNNRDYYDSSSVEKSFTSWKEMMPKLRNAAANIDNES